MGARATITIMLLATTGGCGVPFTFGGGGGGGAGGATTASAASTGTGSTGATMTCDWSATNNTCGAGMYCDACTAGTCAPIPGSPTSESMPSCGCDGVTYWNVSTGESVGVALRYGGVCADADAAKCALDKDCPAGTVCGHDLTKSAGACLSSTTGGVCAGLPKSCDQTTVMGRECPTAMCTNACKLLHDGKRWTASNCN
jgi:hypothetical protein